LGLKLSDPGESAPAVHRDPTKALRPFNYNGLLFAGGSSIPL